MKRFFWFACLGIALSANAQGQAVQHVDSRIDSVKVFLEGAVVYRSFIVQTQAGENTLIFNNLSPSLVASSVNLLLGNGLKPSSISTKTTPWDGNDGYNPLRLALDSVNYYRLQLEHIDNEITALKTEDALLKANQTISGSTQGLNLDRLKEISAYMRTRHLAISEAITDLVQSKGKYQSRMKGLNQEIDRLRHGLPTTKNQIQVAFPTNRNQEIRGTLAYYTRGANWEPEYDISVKSLEESLAIEFKANLYNGSWEDWNNIPVTVSTATPALNVTLPTLVPWNLAPVYREKVYDRAQENPEFLQNIVSDEESIYSMMDEFNPTSEASEFAADYVIPDRVTLGGNFQTNVYAFHTVKTDASYQHYSVPKMGAQVYLIAQIHDWNKLNLLSGKASIYLNDEYTGLSNINIRNITDTLSFSLGIDPQVLVSRKQEDNYTSRGFIGFNVRERKGYALFIKNSRSAVIDIKILDQIPVSTNEDVTVSLLDKSNATLNENNGELTWQREVQPGEVQKLTFGFEIKYPKGKSVNTVQYRSLNRTQRFTQ